MTREEILHSKGLQSQEEILKHINKLKLVYLKNSSNIVFELIKEWETKLENKLKH
jgi:hypothetical protein